MTTQMAHAHYYLDYQSETMIDRVLHPKKCGLNLERLRKGLTCRSSYAQFENATLMLVSNIKFKYKHLVLLVLNIKFKCMY